MPSLEHNALVELFRENPPLAPHLQVELAILSALVHGNSPEGLAVLRAAVTALKRLDPEHSAVYFQIIYAALRDPIRRAMEKLIMERQTNILDPLPPFLQQFADRGELKAKRSTLLRLAQRAGIALTDAERARIEACADTDTLDRWLDNLLGARTAADVLR